MDVLKEAKLLFTLAIPTVAVQLCVFLVFTETASIVGRNLGKTELGGYSLACLTGNLTCLSVVIGCLTASETLSPRAFGSKDYSEVGRIAICGFVTTSVCLIPFLVPLCFFLEVSRSPFYYNHSVRRSTRDELRGCSKILILIFQ